MSQQASPMQCRASSDTTCAILNPLRDALSSPVTWVLLRHPPVRRAATPTEIRPAMKLTTTQISISPPDLLRIRLVPYPHKQARAPLLAP